MRAGRARRRSGSLWALLVVGLVAPTLAGAEWTTSVALSAHGVDAQQPRVAVAADGDAVFTWTRSDGANDLVQARARSAAGTLSAVQTLSAAGQDAFNAEVAVDADGDAVITWQRFDGTHFRVQARARSAAGTLSAVQTLSAAGQHASHPEVAVDADGDAVFTWLRFDGGNYRVQARARSALGALSGRQNLSPGGKDALLYPQVGVDADGDAVFTWTGFHEGDYRVQARARSAPGALSGVQNLSPTGQDASFPQVAVDADGDAVFSWTRSDGANDRVQTRARSSAGTLSVVQNLSDPGQPASDPQVAVDADGDAVFSWTRSDGANDRVQARARSSAGTLSVVQNLSNPGQPASDSQVAVDADGDAVFTWTRSDGANRLAEARTRSAAGALRPLLSLRRRAGRVRPPGLGRRKRRRRRRLAALRRGHQPDPSLSRTVGSPFVGNLLGSDWLSS